MTANSEKTGKKPRGAGKPFVAGKSGNPSGRPKRTEDELDLIAACKDKTPAALAVIESIMAGGQSERTRLAAAIAIIERAHGKAVQPTTLSNPAGGPVDMNWTINFVKPAGER
jgi:hypothetical protein